MRAVGHKLNIDVVSAQEFQARFLPFDFYDAVRKTAPFGSAIDPETGQKDTANYVSVSFITQRGGEVDATIVSEKVASGRILVLTGEYGTGKSKCIEHVYNTLAKEAWTES